MKAGGEVGVEGLTSEGANGSGARDLDPGRERAVVVGDMGGGDAGGDGSVMG